MSNGLRPGIRLGKYLLEKRLGRGAFAEVWKARDTIERIAVALKVALPEAVQAYGRKEIEEEARIAVRLHHPNIVAIRNADWVGRRFVIASDLAVSSLVSYGRARRSPKTALDIIRQVAHGLAYAHSHRVMHRDIKPENIMIFKDGRAAIGDFGASCLARSVRQTYTDAGTLGYLAPEQAYGRPTYSSDVFSLGIIAYELITGFILKWPFEWPPERYRRFVKRVPKEVVPVIKRASKFQPRNRYADGGQFARALEAALARAQADDGVPVRRRRRRARKPVRSIRAVEAEIFRRRHGRRLGLRYHCFRCDGPIAESMRYCPWCGTEDNSFREITDAALVCAWCERGVRPEWSCCPWCYPGRFVANGKKPPFDPKATRQCSRKGCEGQLRPFMRYCPVCKQKVRRVWSDPELGSRCPRCRWPVSREFWRFCPWCGRREPHAGHFVAPRSGG
jgi:hypothetical protein